MTNAVDERLRDDPRALEITMSDGVRLSAVRFPARTERAPVVVMMTPYWKEVSFAAPNVPTARLQDAGYHVVFVDIRSFGSSIAPYQGWLSEREIEDGVELLEWLAKSEFCDGRTAMFGPSYLGIYQLLVAARHPAGLRCIAPMVAPVDTYRDWTHRGGIPSFAQWAAIVYPGAFQEDTMRRGLQQYYGEIMGSPDDEGHRARSPEYVLDQIRVPTLCIGGWYDMFLRGSIRAFQGINAPKRLVVGNWGHADWLPDALDDELLRWLDYWMRDEGEDPAQEEISVWCAGAEEWRTLPAWPASDEVKWTPWRPTAEPIVATAHLTERVVPMRPPVNQSLMVQDMMSGKRLWGEALTVDGDPLEEPTFLVGHVGLSLVAMSDACTDFDVYARLSAVRADGISFDVTEGRLRASHREIDVSRTTFTPDGAVVVPWHPHERAEPMPLSEPVTLDIELDPVCVQLEAGDRLRLGLTIVRADGDPREEEVTLLTETRILLPAR